MLIDNAFFLAMSLYASCLTKADDGSFELLDVALELTALLPDRRLATGIFKFCSDSPDVF